VRFWVTRSVSFGQDGSVTPESLHERYERELANDLGNLVSRTTAMIARYREGTIAPSAGSRLADTFDALAPRVAASFDAYDITGALEEIWEVVRTLNRHVEQHKPWDLAKDDARAEELDRVLYELADGVRAVAVGLHSFVPETSARILDALRQPGDVAWAGVAAGRTVAATGIEPAAPLFPRVDAPTAAA
jgi:methionyl-tRNA synthetase